MTKNTKSKRRKGQKQTIKIKYFYSINIGIGGVKEKKGKYPIEEDAQTEER